MDEISIIGSRIKQARELRGLNQQELAEASGLSQTAITDAERGRSKMPRGLNRIARALGVKIEYLLGQDQSEPEPMPDNRPVTAPPGYVSVKFTAAKLGAGNTAQNADDKFTEIAGGLLFRRVAGQAPVYAARRPHPHCFRQPGQGAIPRRDRDARADPRCRALCLVGVFQPEVVPQIVNRSATSARKYRVEISRMRLTDTA